MKPLPLLIVILIVAWNVWQEYEIRKVITEAHSNYDSIEKLKTLCADNDPYNYYQLDRCPTMDEQSNAEELETAQYIYITDRLLDQGLQWGDVIEDDEGEQYHNYILEDGTKGRVYISEYIEEYNELEKLKAKEIRHE